MANISSTTPTRSFDAKLTPEERTAYRKAQFKRKSIPNWRETYREVGESNEYSKIIYGFPLYHVCIEMCQSSKAK